MNNPISLIGKIKMEKIKGALNGTEKNIDQWLVIVDT